MAAASTGLGTAGALEDLAQEGIAQGVAEVQRGADLNVVAQQVGRISEIVAEAGARDIAEGIDMLAAANDVQVTAALVGVLSLADLDRGMVLARMAGEMAVAGQLVRVLQMPILSAFLDNRGSQLNGMAVAAVLRASATRALAAATAATGKNLAELSANEVAEGIVRLASADTAAEVSAAMKAAGEANQAAGVDALARAEVSDQLAREAAEDAVAEAAVGGVALGAAAERARQGGA
jgi:hypothetical protein